MWYIKAKKNNDNIPIGTVFFSTSFNVGVSCLKCNGRVITSKAYPELVKFWGGVNSVSLPDFSLIELRNYQIDDKNLSN